MAPPTSSTPPTVSFYDPHLRAPDGEGRTLTQVLAFSDNSLEAEHDYIQYLFPLPERSPINPRAPRIDQVTREAFLGRVELRKELLRAVVRIAGFYGFEASGEVFAAPSAQYGKVALFMKPDPSKFDRNSRLWRTRFCHNHLRITRIIRCLRVLGLPHIAAGFHRTLLSNDPNNAISARTKEFWERAATRPLHLAPEVEDEYARGVEWLRDVSEGEGGLEGEGEGFDAQTGRMAVVAREEVEGVLV